MTRRSAGSAEVGLATYPLRADGVGIVFVRADGEMPLLTQAKRCIDFMQSRGREPRKLCVAFGNRRESLYESAALQELLLQAAGSWCQWVICASRSAISTDPATVRELMIELNGSGTALMRPVPRLPPISASQFDSVRGLRSPGKTPGDSS